MFCTNTSRITLWGALGTHGSEMEKGSCVALHLPEIVLGKNYWSQVRRFERGCLIIDLGKTEALIPQREQIPGEVFRSGDRIQAYILDVQDGKLLILVIELGHRKNINE